LKLRDILAAEEITILVAHKTMLGSCLTIVIKEKEKDKRPIPEEIAIVLLDEILPLGTSSN
jgi:hypothetical protein